MLAQLDVQRLKGSPTCSEEEHRHNAVVLSLLPPAEGNEGHQKCHQGSDRAGPQEHQGGNLPLHAASSAGCRASDWEQDAQRDREKCSAVTQAGLSRATTSRQSARKTQSRAISLKGRNT
ncbi:hypothetical protein GOODEAATRI_024706 [Goodea atripinnis]|uniref:Uncharacterized protein n=1 Tax=Goodea atripinnis TaxID=208336 RepID=A0ABV0N470_9TELE